MKILKNITVSVFSIVSLTVTAAAVSPNENPSDDPYYPVVTTAATTAEPTQATEATHTTEHTAATTIEDIPPAISDNTDLPTFTETTAVSDETTPPLPINTTVPAKTQAPVWTAPPPSYNTQSSGTVRTLPADEPAPIVSTEMSDGGTIYTYTTAQPVIQLPSTSVDSTSDDGTTAESSGAVTTDENGGGDSGPSGALMGLIAAVGVLAVVGGGGAALTARMKKNDKYKY